VKHDDELVYVMEGSRRDLARFAQALSEAGIESWIRPKDGCPPSG
jgi:hypothetical protein